MRTQRIFGIIAVLASISSAATPITEMGNQLYKGYSGGLYENSLNTAPADHNQAGLFSATLVKPLDVNGTPSTTGKVVLLSIGMSNTTYEWCGFGSVCNTPQSFMYTAAHDSRVNHSNLVILNGARPGIDAKFWVSPTLSEYDRVKTQVLAPAGVTEKQVQAIWLKQADMGPTSALPLANANAYSLEQELGNILRAVKVRYPNVRQVFLSSRIFAGFATTQLNPEPYAYESGFSVKWVVQAQIDQMRNGGTPVSSLAGNLNYKTGAAAWIAWGPYMWANGQTPRADGLFWQPGDFQSDGTHPSTSGAAKVTAMLMNFFLNSPYTPWFRASGH
jgi:hypothetical protein